MGLRNLPPVEAKVEVPGGGSFAVRGLDPDMVVGLYQRHAGQLSEVWDSAMARAQGKDITADVHGMVAGLIGDAPQIMAELIAIASGSQPTDTYVDPDTTVNPLGLTDYDRDVVAARRLPLPVQVDALQKVAGLTFSSDMPPGKFLAVVVQIAGATTAAFNPPAKS